jgi:hypothetical protein
MNASVPATCLNCGSTLTGPYCARCGQKVPHTDLTLRELVHDATEELAHWEGKIPRTLTALLLKPGLLTQDFLAGRRAKWLPPLRVYLICSVAYFAMGPLIEAITHRPANGPIKFGITDTDGSGQLTPEERSEIEAGFPARVLGKDRLERALSDPAAINREVNLLLPKGMFVLLPIFALLTRVAWRRQMPRYPAHLYVALHIHAAWFATLALAAMVMGLVPVRAVQTLVGVAMVVYVVWYGLMAVRRVFGQSWPRTIGKAAAVTTVYMVCQVVVSFFLLGYAITRM